MNSNLYISLNEILFFCSKTAAEEKLVDIECGMPAKLMFKYNHVDEESKIVVNRKTNKVVANKDKDLKLTFTLKDKKGKTFTSVDSLNIETKVSDDSLLTPETTYAINPTIKVSSFGSVSTRRKCNLFFSNIFFLYFIN